MKTLIAYFSHAGQNWSHGGSGLSNSLAPANRRALSLYLSSK